MSLSTRGAGATDRIAVGRAGEDEAARLLEKSGYRLVERNYRCRYGEIDIIAMDGDTVVFVEVKTRGSDAFGSGKQSVDGRKQRRMVAVSSNWLSEKGLEESAARFDVVSIDVSSGSFVSEIIRNAFDA